MRTVLFVCTVCVDPGAVCILFTLTSDTASCFRIKLNSFFVQSIDSHTNHLITIHDFSTHAS